MSDDSIDEYEIVADMLDAAAKYNLQVEVVVDYAKYRIRGDDPNKAAWAALYDWDI